STINAGAAGNVTVNVGSLILAGGGQIVNNSAFSGTGDAADQTITATKSILISGQSPDGQPRAFFSNDPSSGLFSSSKNSGKAGTITVTTPVIKITDGGKITTDATAVDGGNINLNVAKLVYLLNGQMTTSVQGGQGKGGNINIDPQAVTLNHSQITANAFGGPGGNIKIVADTFLASQDSSVTASSALSTPGTVDIQAAITNIAGLLQPLPENIFQATSLLQQSCAARYSSGKLSSLVVGSLVGLPWEPGSFMPSPLYRLAEKSNPSITQAGPGAESFQLTLASAKPKFSLNWPCVK